jgi:hypothetical protein
MRELRLSDREVDSALRRLAHIMSGGVRKAEERLACRARADGRDLTSGRFTAVLEQRDDRRLVVQTHFLLPAAEQTEGRSF